MRKRHTSIQKLYNNITNGRLWNYYNIKFHFKNIRSDIECCNFIKSFIEYSGKTQTVLFNSIDQIYNQNPKRMTHIVATYFLGLSIIRNRKLGIEHDILYELKKLKRYSNKPCKYILFELPFIWFTVTLFHDLGYLAEDCKKGKSINNLPLNKLKYYSVPEFYIKTYKRYYEFRNNKEHGIYAGIKFYTDMCNIRRYQENQNNRLKGQKLG